MTAPVPLSLRDVRALRDLLLIRSGPAGSALRTRLERAIRKAERALVPGKFRRYFYGDLTGGGRRVWPNGFGAVEAWKGWEALTPDGVRIASGPETGAEGRKLADRALRRWLRRQGVDWRAA